MDQTKKRITIIVPAYNEEQALDKFYDALIPVIKGLDKYDWLVRFIDDGSKDNTWGEIEALSKKDPSVSGIQLSRNFGKEIALTAGAESACDTDAIIFIDADLQHPPEVIPALIENWESGYYIVSTRRKSIEYGWLRVIGAKMFYAFLNRYSHTNITPYGTDFRLLDKKVLRILCTFQERTRFFRGLIDWVGFKRTVVFFDAPSRSDGKSSFEIKDLFRLAINSITTFSLIPLRFAGYLGIAILTLSALTFLYMTVNSLLGLNIFTPIAYFTVLNTFLFGVVLSALGMMALYIGHIHTEVVQRPLYIIQEALRIDAEDE